MNDSTYIPSSLLLIVLLVCLWRIFAKAGEPGWQVLFPFINIYVLLRVAGKSGWWLLLMLIPVVNIAIWILACIGLASQFGKGPGYALGLVFVPVIFFPLLAFGSAEYKGNPLAVPY